MLNRRTSGVLLAFLVVVGLATALVPGLAAAEIRIGVLLPLSGKASAYGLTQEVGMKMAVDDLEKTGIKGEPVKLVVYDTRGDNNEAISLTRKLIHTDKVLAIIGPFFSAECEVAFPIAVQGKTPIITAAAAKPGIAAKNRPWAFRNALTSDKLDGPLIDKWTAANKGKIKQVVILTDIKDAFTKADGTLVFPAVLKARGITVLDNVSFQTGDLDFSAQVTKVKSLNPDGIVVAGLYNDGGNVVREIRKQGMTQPIVGALGMSEGKYIDIAGAAAEGSMVVNPFWADSPEPRIKAWVGEFNKRSQTPPNNGATLLYDSLHIMKGCVEKTGVTNRPGDLEKDREKIRDCWTGLKDYPGVTGTISMNADGDAVLEPFVLVVRNGKFELVK
ncbi:MAG TPA: ABC transporter substrate-binding protein [Methylomirabilota bacterium]|jgi:branched-chain amino acid transport system substrate-binding protein|nr:ABC transporter substrate-binding protein [Methylomirabilota bacterium]